MALGFYFHGAAVTTAQYDEAVRKLEAAGAGKPKGRLFHSAFGESGSLSIYDVWESQADFDKFGETLMPILAEVGMDPGVPSVVPMHNFIFG
jgi:hypothetical protein